MLIAGGPLAVTDANLVLGRLLPEFFPKIFGPKENEPLDLEATRAAFKKLTQEVLQVTILVVTERKSSKHVGPCTACSCMQVCSAAMHLHVQVCHARTMRLVPFRLTAS